LATINWIKANLRGKLGEVVGSSWKGTHYVKTYTKPGNPRTPGQLAVRGIFKHLSTVASGIYHQVLKPYTFPTPQKMTAYNYMIHVNKPMITRKEWDPADLKIFNGPYRTLPITAVLVSNKGLPNEEISIDTDLVEYPDPKKTPHALIGVIYDAKKGVVLHGIYSDENSNTPGLFEGVEIKTADFNYTVDFEDLHAYLVFVQLPVQEIGRIGMVSGTAYKKVTSP